MTMTSKIMACAKSIFAIAATIVALSCASPAFAQNAPPPLAARPDLQRPRGPLAFETKNTA